MPIQDATTQPWGNQHKRRKFKRLCITFGYIYLLNDYRELNSYEEPCITLVETITSLARELNPTGVGGAYIYIYIVIHRQICFVLSELFSVARFPKLGSKLGWLKRQSKILPLYIYIYIYIYIILCSLGFK